MNKLSGNLSNFSPEGTKRAVKNASINPAYALSLSSGVQSCFAIIAIPPIAPYLIAGGAQGDTLQSPPVNGIDFGIPTSHPAPSPLSPGPSQRFICNASSYASSSFGANQISALAFGFPRNAATNALWSTIIRGPRAVFTSSMYFRNVNCASAFSFCAFSRSVLAEVKSSLNLRNCSACFSFMRSPRISAAEPETRGCPAFS